MSYSLLKETILKYLVLEGDSTAESMCATWIRLAECELRMAMSRLLVPASEEIEDNYEITGEYNDLPSGFIRARVVQLNDNEKTRLTYVAPQSAPEYSSVGKPKHYTVQGRKLRVFPAPDNDYTASLTFFSLPSLSDTASTNWLLDGYEKIYLWACLAEAHAFYMAVKKKEEKLSDLNRMLGELETTQGLGNVASDLHVRIGGMVV